MKRAALLAACLCLQACARDPHPERGTGYVQAAPAPSGQVAITITAPEAHPLFLSNCNGQVMWRLVEAGWATALPGRHDWEWADPIQLCAGPSIRIEPGRALTLVRPLPSNGFGAGRGFWRQRALGVAAAPPGAYRVQVVGLHSDWTPPDPRNGLRGRATPVPPDLVTSGVIVID